MKRVLLLSLSALVSTALVSADARAELAYKYRVKAISPILGTCSEGSSRAKARVAELRADGKRDVSLVLRLCTVYGFKKLSMDLRVVEAPAGSDGLLLMPESQNGKRLAPIQVTLGEEETLGKVLGWSAGMLPWARVRIQHQHPMLSRPLVIDGELYEVENEE